jgi:hypothetical protein
MVTLAPNEKRRNLFAAPPAEIPASQVPSYWPFELRIAARRRLDKCAAARHQSPRTPPSTVSHDSCSLPGHTRRSQSRVPCKEKLVDACRLMVLGSGLSRDYPEMLLPAASELISKACSHDERPRLSAVPVVMQPAPRPESASPQIAIRHDSDPGMTPVGSLACRLSIPRPGSADDGDSTNELPKLPQQGGGGP